MWKQIVIDKMYTLSSDMVKRDWIIEHHGALLWTFWSAFVCKDSTVPA